MSLLLAQFLAWSKYSIINTKCEEERKEEGQEGRKEEGKEERGMDFK